MSETAIVASRCKRTWPLAWLRKMTGVLSVALAAAGALVTVEAQTQVVFQLWPTGLVT